MWQPIESAPKNGASMLLCQPWRAGIPQVFIGYYANGWIMSGAGDEWEVETTPTHWQPLPEPPTPTSEATTQSAATVGG